MGLESIDRITKRMFKQINFDNFEEFTSTFVKKNKTHIKYKPTNADDTENNI